MKKVLLTGGSGVLGKEIIKIYDKQKYKFIAPTSKEMDIINISDCMEVLSRERPNIVLHAAAYTDVRNSEIDYIKSIETNILGTCNIIKCCDALKIKLVYISTDYVFDGEKGDYTTKDAINPLTNYAKSKAAGELAVRMYLDSLVVRTSFFGHNFPYEKAFIDQWSSKDYIDIIAPKILEECLSDRTGIVHVGSSKRSLYEIAIQRKTNVIKSSINDVNLKIPKDTSLI